MNAFALIEAMLERPARPHLLSSLDVFDIARQTLAETPGSTSFHVGYAAGRLLGGQGTASTGLPHRLKTSTRKTILPCRVQVVQVVLGGEIIE
jgi:hypothetical protein